MAFQLAYTHKWLVFIWWCIFFSICCQCTPKKDKSISEKRMTPKEKYFNFLVVCALNKIKNISRKIGPNKTFKFLKFPSLIYNVNYNQQDAFPQLLPIPPTILLY